jgi:vacuolar-type H+-ATPase subunit F/Vma7
MQHVYQNAMYELPEIDFHVNTIETRGGCILRCVGYADGITILQEGDDTEKLREIIKDDFTAILIARGLIQPIREKTGQERMTEYMNAIHSVNRPSRMESGALIGDMAKYATKLEGVIKDLQGRVDLQSKTIRACQEEVRRANDLRESAERWDALYGYAIGNPARLLDPVVKTIICRIESGAVQGRSSVHKESAEAATTLLKIEQWIQKGGKIDPKERRARSIVRQIAIKTNKRGWDNIMVQTSGVPVGMSEGF